MTPALRRAAALVALGAALPVAGCSSGGSPAAGPQAQRAPETQRPTFHLTERVFSDRTIRAALARATDFGPGWRSLGEFSGASASDPQGGCLNYGIAMGGGLFELADDVRHFRSGGLTAAVALNRHPTPEDAASTVGQDVPTYGSGDNACRPFTDSSTGIRYSIRPLALPPVGDGSFATEVTATSGSSTRTYDEIVFSHGNVVGAVVVSGTPAPASLVERVARAMLARLT